MGIEISSRFIFYTLSDAVNNSDKTTPAPDDPSAVTPTPVDEAGITPADEAGITPADETGITPADEAGITPVDEAELTPSVQDDLTQPLSPTQMIESTGVPETVPTKNNSSLMIWISVLALVVLALCILSFYLEHKLRKKKTAVDSEKPMKISVGNLHHVGKRENQQDSFGVSDIANEQLCAEKGVFAVVADGMGGLSCGAEISAIVSSHMLEFFNSVFTGQSVSDELLQMISETNNEACEYIQKNGNMQSGSTVVATLIQNRKLYFVAVGDSRIYLLRDGALVQINREHTHGRDMDERFARGEISYKEAKEDHQRTALTSHIGMTNMRHVDYNTRPITLLPGDRILLMSDGVFGTLTDDEITACAALENSVFEAANQMEKMILGRNKKNQDNFTAIIMQIA